VAGSGLSVGQNGRVKVDRHLRVLDHPQIYAAGDVASVTDPRSGTLAASGDRGEELEHSPTPAACVHGPPWPAVDQHHLLARVGHRGRRTRQPRLLHHAGRWQEHHRLPLPMELAGRTPLRSPLPWSLQVSCLPVAAYRDTGNDRVPPSGRPAFCAGCHREEPF